MVWSKHSLLGLLSMIAFAVLSAESSCEEPTWPREWATPSGITYQLRGRIDTDAIFSEQSPENEATFGDLGNVVGLRRARIGLEGALWDEGSYVAEIDLASGEVVIRDLYAASPGWFDSQTQLGHFREPFSLEGGTSARFFAFMERSPVNTLDPSRNWGLGLMQMQPTDDSALAIGAFYGGPDPSDLEGGPGSTAGVTAKLTAAPIDEENGRYLLHFGAAVAERLPLDGIIIVNQKPRSPLLELGDSSTSPFTPTMKIPADFQHILNAQLAVAHGPAWAHAEWYGTFIDQPSGAPIFFQGNYVDVGYFLTGEHRQYDRATGVLGEVEVQRPFLYGPASRGREWGMGGWELAARLAWLDFINANTPLGANGQLQGVEQTQWTFGLNWYLTDRLRLMFNYSYVLPTNPNTGPSTANIFATRLGYFW